MAQQTVRIGYIGAGRFSRNRLLPGFKGVPGVELVVVCNSSPESSRQVASDFGFQRTASDWREVVEASDIDAIVLGTRTALHHEMALPTLDAGKHLLTMNAMARTLDEAVELYEKSKEKSDLVSLVYPAQFYTREDAMLRWLLEERYVGETLSVMDYWYTPFFGLGSQFEVANRWFGDHTRVLAYRKRFDVESPGVDQHERDVRPETNVVVSELRSGATITYLHTTMAGGTALARFEIYGTEGVLTCYPQGQSRQGFFGARTGDSDFRTIEVPPHLRQAWDSEYGITVEADFIAAIRGEGEPSPAIPRFEDGLKLMQFTETWRAAQTGGAWADVSG